MIIFKRGEAYAPDCPADQCNGGKMKFIGTMGPSVKEYKCKKCGQVLWYAGTWNQTRQADRFAEKVSGGKGIESEPGKIIVGV